MVDKMDIFCCKLCKFKAIHPLVTIVDIESSTAKHHWQISRNFSWNKLLPWHHSLAENLRQYPEIGINYAEKYLWNGPQKEKMAENIIGTISLNSKTWGFLETII